jgi:hypothetical protein
MHTCLPVAFCLTISFFLTDCASEAPRQTPIADPERPTSVRVVAGVLGNPKAAEQYPNIYPRLMLCRQARYCVLAAARPVFPARCAMKIRRHHGKLIPEGTVVRNPEWARTLRRSAPIRNRQAR